MGLVLPAMTWWNSALFNYTSLDQPNIEFTGILPVDQILVGDRLFIEIAGKQIVLFNLAGKIFAIGDVCSHDNGPLGDGEVEENEIICPRHGARFDIQTGKATSLPALVDIPAYPVRVVNGILEIGVPKN